LGMILYLEEWGAVNLKLSKATELYIWRGLYF
jgi:hypothetical protein